MFNAPGLMRSVLDIVVTNTNYDQLNWMLKICEKVLIKFCHH
jgi:hypothetical protein